MDDPKEGGLLTPDGAAGLPTGSSISMIYVAFLSLLFIIKPKWLNEQIKTLYMSKNFIL